MCTPPSIFCLQCIVLSRWYSIVLLHLTWRPLLYMSQHYLLLLLCFTTLFNILGHQRRFRHWAWKVRQILLRGSNFGLRFFLRAVNARHGTHGFTSLPKEVIVRIFTLWKNPSTPVGTNPRTSGPDSSIITTGPPGRRTLLMIYTICHFVSNIISILTGIK